MRIAFIALLLICVSIIFLSRSPSTIEQPSAPPAKVTPPKLRPPRNHPRSDPAAFAAKIEISARSGEPSQREHVFSEVLPALVSLDPFAAVALMEKIEAGEFRDEFIVQLARLWAAQDPESALKWAAEIKGAAERYSAVRSACLQISQVDPAAAIHTMESLNIPNDRSVLENIVQSWTAEDATAATEWALERPPGETRDNLLTRVAFVVSQDDPRQAADLIVKNIPPGASQSEAAISILHRWALQDWEGAKQWADQYPEGPLRERAQNEIAGVKNHLTGSRAGQ